MEQADTIGLDLAKPLFQAHGTDASGRAAFLAAARSDVVFLCVPLEAYPAVLAELAPVIRPGSVVVDTCSVKAAPERLIAPAAMARATSALTAFRSAMSSAGTPSSSVFAASL